MEEALLCALFIPLVSSLLLLFSSLFIRRSFVLAIGCGSVLLSFFLFSQFLYSHLQENTLDPKIITLFQWIPLEGINAQFTLAFDSLSLWMTMIITGVGFLIHLYSAGYMEDEKDLARYYACLNFFIFAMLLLVLAADLLLLFVGWEGVGLASYLLIGFWNQRPAANQAATKAFVINRIGDFGYLLALLLTFKLFGTANIADISERAGKEFATGAPILLLLTFLYFFAATGKSAQLPLYTWLPDAMEGPTPVSALIHAATMVTAGVYLIVRLHALFLLAPETMQLIGVVGGVTSLFAAICAVGQSDLKRVLAYSTISQIGLMFLACGIGAFYPAMFHLTTHAFIKALLFLSAGNIIHMMHGKTEMDQMGGLRKKLPATHLLFFTGVIALSGIPPLSAFFSKDMILEQEYISGHTVLFFIAFAASVLTAFYLTRAYCLTFLGKPNPDQSPTLHEAPKIMLIPVAVLGLLAILGGFLGCVFCDHPFLQEFLGGSGVTLAEREPVNFLTPETWLSIGGAFAGVGTAFFLYFKAFDSLRRPITLFKSSFYVNELYWRGIGQPLLNVSTFVSRRLEPFVFDGSLKETVKGTQFSARLLQRVQSGEIRSYAAWMIIGAVSLIAYLVI